MFHPPSDSFEALPLPTGEPWKEDRELKKLYGVALGKGLEPFKAGLQVLGDNANKALWASHYWKNDPVVIASKEQYVETVDAKSKLLDKNALSVILLDFANEKDISGKFNTADHKDRVAYLKLYAEIQGMIGKVDINNTINNNTITKMELVLVKAPTKEEKKPTIIENNEPEIRNVLPANIKLVSSAAR